MRNAVADPDLSVFLVCTTLGRVPRGFESFSAECFQALRTVPGIRVTLFQGHGSPAEGIRVLRSFSESSVVARVLGRLAQRGATAVAQVSFGLSLLPHIASARPAVVYFSEPAIGEILWHCRQAWRFDYRLLLSNGGPVSWDFLYWDHVQQLTPAAHAGASAAGWALERQTLLPYGISTPEGSCVSAPEAKREARRRLRLPLDRKIILSVAALERSHKRLDYLVAELGDLPPPRPFLLLLGAETSETADVLEQARQRLGGDGFTARTVPYPSMSDYYAAADVVTHVALHEGFGRVFLESLLHGVPVVAHHFEGARHVLGEHATYVDMRRPGLGTVLQTELVRPCRATAASAQRRREYVRRRFDWSVLAGQYAAMLRRCAAQPVKPVSREGAGFGRPWSRWKRT